MTPQAPQTLFEIYICDSIALRFEPFKRMYETVRNHSKFNFIVKDLNKETYFSLLLCYFEVFVAAEAF